MLKCLNCQNDLPNDAHHFRRCGLRLIRPPDDSVPSIPSWNLTPEQWDEAFKEMGLDTEEADNHKQTIKAAHPAASYKTEELRRITP